MIARLIGGALLLGLAAGTVWVGTDLDAGAPVPAPAPVSVTTAPSEVPAVCAGPAQLADPAAPGDPAFDPSPVGTDSGVVADASAGSTGALRTLAGEVVPTPEGVVAASVPGPSVLWTTPVEGMVRASATAWSRTTEGDLRGLAAASCQTPTTEQWLLGGSTELGSSARLVLQNPNRTAATVEVEVWGPTGRLELAGPGTFSVPAGGQASTLLEGLAAEQRRLAVRVVSTGATVTSYLQVNSLDGLRPTGVELVPPTRGPATRQVLAGVAVEASRADGDGASVRVHVPDATEGSVTVDVALLGPQGRVALPGAETLAVVPGEVTDLSLAGLPAGSYAVVLDAAVPFVASASYPRADAASGAVDVAHVSAGEPASAGGVAVPPGTSLSVAVSAVPADVSGLPSTVVGVGESPVVSDPDAAEPAGATAGVSLTFLGPDGTVLETRTSTISAGTTVAAPGPPGTAAVRLDTAPTDGLAVHWAAHVLAAPGLVSALLPVEAADVTVSVTVADVRDVGLGLGR